MDWSTILIIIVSYFTLSIFIGKSYFNYRFVKNAIQAYAYDEDKKAIMYGIFWPIFLIYLPIKYIVILLIKFNDYLNKV